MDQVAESGEGFMLVHETPGKEVVVGAVGQFWHLNIPFAKLKPEDFRTFDKPGWGKLAWAIAVEPFAEGSTIGFELRTTATDEESWRDFNKYYQMIGLTSNLIRHSVMAHLEADLGRLRLLNDDERVLPADEMIDAKYSITFSKYIEAPISIVWRYLMQLGCDRAGWYSIDKLDHGGVPSVDHLVDGWETRAVGDKLAATPAQDSFYDVYQVEHEKHLVVGGETDRMGGPFKMTWAFIVEPVGEDATHLITRARMISSPKWAEWLMGNLIYPPVHGLMSGVQLKNIKRLAERDAQIRMAVAILDS
ncbi:MAG: SRPBCC family protein [Methanobacteriota archaeon]|nr:MAG: SRPBCC family protein [Euryarchaeota archaeon]